MKISEVFDGMKEGKKFRTPCLLGYLHAIKAEDGFVYVYKSFKDDFSIAITELSLQEILDENWEEYISDERDTPIVAMN